MCQNILLFVKYICALDQWGWWRRVNDFCLTPNEQFSNQECISYSTHLPPSAFINIVKNEKFYIEASKTGCVSVKYS